MDKKSFTADETDKLMKIADICFQICLIHLIRCGVCESHKKTKKLLTNERVYFILGQNSMGEVNYVETACLTKEVNKT
jgi:hypothetical protein